MLHVRRIRPVLPPGSLRIFAFACALALPAVIATAWPHARNSAVALSGTLSGAPAQPAVPVPEMPERAAQSEALRSTDTAFAKAETPSAAGATHAAAHPSARALERDGTLDLIVPDVDRALAKLRADVSAYGGDFLELNDNRPDSPSTPRSLDAKVVVPQNEFDRAMNALAGLGGVRARSATAQDVGDQLVDDAARLRNLRRTERDLLAIMDRSGKLSDVLDVENQLSDVRDQIERLDAERSALAQRVADATIALTITAEAAQQPGPAEPSVAAQISAAWNDARHAAGHYALALLHRALFALVFAPFWIGGALLLTAAALGARALVRRYLRRAATA